MVNRVPQYGIFEFKSGMYTADVYGDYDSAFGIAINFYKMSGCRRSFYVKPLVT